jgi:hypothetical protein
MPKRPKWVKTCLSLRVVRMFGLRSQCGHWQPKPATVSGRPRAFGSKLKHDPPLQVLQFARSLGYDGCKQKKNALALRPCCLNYLDPAFDHEALQKEAVQAALGRKSRQRTNFFPHR